MKTTKPHPDSRRLETLIQVYSGSYSDFAQMLFFARRKTKTEFAAYRRALDEWAKTR